MPDPAPESAESDTFDRSASPPRPEPVDGRRQLHVVGAAILRRDGDRARVLAGRRAPHTSSPGYWELPGGKVEDHETPVEALRREIREELALEIEVGHFLARGRDERPGLVIVLDVYLARRIGGVLHPTDHDRVEWITADEIEGRVWGRADEPILPVLEELLRSQA